MSYFKNNPDFTLFYSDTDSAYISGNLPENMISSIELGKMKLEIICNKAVFLAPKVYGLLDENNNQIIKVKGLSTKSLIGLKFNDLEKLLVKDSNMKFLQNKWFRSIKDGNITIMEQLYNLQVTANKRNLIYFNNKLINTNSIIRNNTINLNSLNEDSKLKIKIIHDIIKNLN